MQTTVLTRVYSDASHDLFRATRTIDHLSKFETLLNCIYGGLGGVANPHVVDIQNGGNVLDVVSTPPALMQIVGNPSTAQLVNSVGSSLSLTHHNIKSLSVGVYGVIARHYAITEWAEDGDNVDFTIDNTDNLGMAYLKSSPVSGYFDVNGGYFYFLFGNYSEQQVYIEDCGIYDENGDPYLYDEEDSNMEITEINDIKATNTLIFDLTDGELVVNDGIGLDGQIYYFTNDLDRCDPGYILMGATEAETVENLMHAINGTGVEMVNYSRDTEACTNVIAINYKADESSISFDVEAMVGGVGGNTISSDVVDFNQAGHFSWKDGPYLIGGETITYGLYTRQLGAITAEAMQRCINAMFPTPVVTVTYDADDCFNITSIVNNINFMAVVNDVYSLSEQLGFDGNAVFNAGIEISDDIYAYVEDVGLCPINTITNNVVNAVATIAQGITPTQMYLIDTSLAVQVQVLDA